MTVRDDSTDDLSRSSSDDELTKALLGADDRERHPRLLRYVLLDLVGEGGFGAVYTAYDPELGRKVAIKILHGRDRLGSTAREAQARLLREAQALARFSHPNVVSVFDVGTHRVGDDDVVFVVMELIEGATLSVWLAAERRGPAPVSAMLLQAGRGLAAAHDEGLVHRDFKPSNVIVSNEGTARVVDFGLARLADPTGRAVPPVDGDERRFGALADRLDGPLTASGAVMGTPPYLAPEQHVGSLGDVRSDQYSFCVTLYEALWGRRPFDGRTMDELLEQKLRGAPPMPAEPRVPRRIADAVRRGLSADPAARFADMHELLARLRPTPRSRVLPIVGVGVATALLATLATVVLTGDDDAADCDETPQRLDAAWNAERAAKVRAALLANDQPFAGATARYVQTELDARLTEWGATYQDACRATHVLGTQSVELLDRRVACLDGNLRDIAALVDVFEQADAQTTTKAAEAVGAVPSAQICSSEAVLASGPASPVDPERDALLAPLRDEIARARALGRAGKYEQSVSLADTTCDAVLARGDDELIAEAFTLCGEMRLVTGRLDDAEDGLHVALHAARRRGLLARELRILASLGHITHLQGHDEVGLRWIELGLSLVDQAPGRDDLEFALRTAHGNVLLGGARLDEAQTSYERAYELAVGDGNLRNRMTALANLGAVAGQRGELVRAADHARGVLELVDAELGPDHPWGALVHGNLAVALQQLGRTAEARQHYERSAALVRASGLPRADLADRLNGIGETWMADGEWTKAVAVFEEALAVAEEAWPPTHRDVAMIRLELAWALARAGRTGEALAPARAALVVAEEALEPNHPQLGIVLCVMGDIESLAGNQRIAVDLLERGIAVQRAAHGPDQSYRWADASTTLGETRLAMGANDEAIAALEQALDGYSRAPGEPSAMTRRREADARTALALARR